MYGPIGGSRIIPYYPNGDGYRCQIYAYGFSNGFSRCEQNPEWLTVRGLTYGEAKDFEILSITLESPGTTTGYTLSIKDKNNSEVYSKDFIKKPTYQVACGCEIGEIQCGIPPNICCIPCSEIKEGIASATAMLRMINRG
jgi:hypothetical protein